MSLQTLASPKESLPRGWMTTQPSLLIREERNGDWGEPPESTGEDANLVKVVRGTDFASAQAGSCIHAPLRRVRTSSIAKRELAAGDILVELSGGSSDQATGRALLIRDGLLHHADHPVLFTNFVKRVRVDTSLVTPEFFWRAWAYAYWQGRTKTYEKRTTGIRNFKYRDFVSSEVFLIPPLPEQRAIARVLRTVQEAIEATERTVEAARELKRSMMEYLFTYGPVPVDQADRVEQQEARFGQVPLSWSIPALEECATVQTGIAKGRRVTSGRTISAPYLRVANVQDGFLDLNEIKSIEIRPGEESRYGLRFGDVLLTEGGDSDKLGRGAIWRDEIPDCVHQNHVFAVRADSALLGSEYLGYLVQTRYSKAYFLNVAHRTTHLACINSAKLKALPVPLPSAPEQQKIARHLEKVDGYLELQIDRAKALGGLFSSLLHNLMTGKVRVTPTEQDMEAGE